MAQQEQEERLISPPYPGLALRHLEQLAHWRDHQALGAPARLATHIGIAGEPNDWSTPSQFLMTMATLLGVFVVLHTMVGWLERVPDRSQPSQ